MMMCHCSGCPLLVQLGWLEVHQHGGSWRMLVRRCLRRLYAGHKCGLHCGTRSVHIHNRKIDMKHA
jgi:hypothetical protein